MVAPIIHVNYEVLEQTAQRFTHLAQDIHHLYGVLDSTSQELVRVGWQGQGAAQFDAEMVDKVLPRLEKLTHRLAYTSEVVDYLRLTFQQAEEEASRPFRSAQEQFLQAVDRFVKKLLNVSTPLEEQDKILKDLDSASKRRSKIANIRDYLNKDGWSVVDTNQFRQNDLVEQIGGSCVIYGILNTLIMRGVKISQAEADQILKELTAKYGQDSGFPHEAVRDILGRYGINAQEGNFANGFPEGLWNPTNRGAAEQFLKQTVQSGKPVYVTSQVDESFGMGGDSGHAYTVLGVQTDSSGRITKVLVSTNWGRDLNSDGIPDYENDVRELDGEKFMNDWMQHEKGRYVVVNN